MTKVLAKTCPKCSTHKQLVDFHGNKTKPDGRNAICKECMKQVSKNWRNQPAGRAKQMWTTSKKRAEDKGWSFELTPEWIQQKLEAGVCEATGIPLELASEDSFKLGYFRPWTPSLDRTDCSLGYTPDNVRLVCWMYNQAKGVSSHENVVRFAKAIVAHG